MKYTCKLTVDTVRLIWHRGVSKHVKQCKIVIDFTIFCPVSLPGIPLAEPIFPTFTALKKKKLGELFTSETKNWLG